MNRLFVLLMFFAFSFGFDHVAYGKHCYLFITNPATFKYDTVFEIGSALLKNFVADVQPVPRSGLGKNDCVYNLSVLSDQGAITTSITGPEINSIGESTSTGILGLQKAIVLTIYRSDEELREEICSVYQSLIQTECQLLEESEPNFAGVWHINYQEDKEEIFAAISENNQVLLCEYKNEKLSDVSDGTIENGQLFWGEDEKFAITMDGNDTLVIYFEDPGEFTRVEEMPENCLKRLKEEKLY